MPDAPPNKLTIPLTIIGLLLTAGGLWIAISDYMRKGNDARPVLDVTEMKVIRRLGINNKDYVSFNESDSLSITITNTGTVEAASVVFTDTAWDSVNELKHDGGKPSLPTIRRPDMLPGKSITFETTDDTIKGPSDLVPTVFRGRITYTNRLNGHEYTEPTCFYTAAFVMMRDFPNGGQEPELSIPLVHCPVGM